jgi:effector-binding domain-containing protein
MHEVLIRQSTPRTIAAVRARLAVATVPASFGRYLDQVYAAGKAGAVQLDGQNIFLYQPIPDRPDDADCAFGVGVKAPFASPTGNVELTSLPIGEVAMTTHWGNYSGIRAAHQAVIAWCKENGRRRTGTRWEVYGHWTDDESRLSTEIYHLLEPR